MLIISSRSYGSLLDPGSTAGMTDKREAGMTDNIKMTTLKEQINNDLKQAMRDKDELGLSVLRMLAAAIRNKEIMMRKGEDVSLTDQQTQEVAASEIKKRRDSVTEYKKGGRADLADKEKKEIAILEKYLPEQLNDEEIEKVVKEVVSVIGEVKQSDFGKVMGQAMARVKGKADGTKVGEAVKKVLTK